MGRYRIQRKNHKITNTNYTKRRHYTFISCKLARTTANYHQQNFTGRTHQPIRKHLRKIQQTIRKQPHNHEFRSKDSNQTRILPHPLKSPTGTIPPTERCEKSL